MNEQNIQPFHVIGLSIRTTNENGQSSQDIPLLWAKFISEGTAAKIPNKLSEDLYCIYTEYEKDHTLPYTTLLGCKVENLNNIPEGMSGLSFKGGSYIKRTAKGNIMEGLVFKEWLEIWKADLPRVFSADFEVYGAKAQNPIDAEVDIFIAVK